MEKTIGLIGPGFGSTVSEIMKDIPHEKVIVIDSEAPMDNIKETFIIKPYEHIDDHIKPLTGRERRRERRKLERKKNT